MATKQQKDGQGDEIKLARLELVTVELELEGDSPLIVHKWSQKAKEQMLAKQTKRATTGKEPKDPQRDYEESIYYREDGTYGFPAVGFKAAFVRAGTYADHKMTFLRGSFHVDGELVPIFGSPKPREDMVRVGAGVADIRYRAEFIDWSARIPVQLNCNALSVEQLVNIARIAGFAVGIGEWRPERNGSYGRFSVVDAAIRKGAVA